MLDRKRVNSDVEEIVRKHWTTGQTEMGTIISRIELIRELKAFMDETVEKAMREGHNA